MINFSFVSSIRLINVFWSEFGQNFYEIGSEFGQNFALFSIFEGQNSKNFLWQHWEWSAAIPSYSLVPPLHSLASDFKQRGAEVAATHSMALAISAPSWRFHCVVPLIGLGVFHRNDGFVMLLLLSSPLDDIDSVIWRRGCF